MGSTCYLCELNSLVALVGATPAGEGFGTCHECWVHACQRHGERRAQYFRCADCIAADPATAALTVTAPQAAAKVAAFRGESPQMSIAAAAILKTADRPRMSAALSWLHRQAQGEGDLALASDAQKPLTDLRRPLDAEKVDLDLALGLQPSVARVLDAHELRDVAAARAHALERQGLDLLQISAPPMAPDSLGVWGDSAQVELASTAIAVSYAAREQPDLMRSPLEIAGGLQLPAPVAVIAHAYSQADRLFW